MTEAAYVDYTEFDQEIIGYLTLFNKDGGENFNYADIQAATGWDGTAFEGLTEVVGKKILFWVEAEEYNGKTRLKVKKVAAPDASPTRSLKSLDATELKALSAKFITKKAKPVVAKAPGAAKAPVNPPTKPVAAKPSAAPSVAAKPTASATTPATSTSKPKATKAPPPPPAPVEETTDASLPEETTKDDAWAYIFEHKGDNTDDVMTDAFLSACSEVAGPEGADQKQESQFTGKDWARVRDIVRKDCSLS
jgi:hypothetical protein